MSEVKHTPTPWKIDDWYGDTQIIGSDESCVCTDTEFYPVAPSDEDMNHIVKCVNMHDELVEALKDILIACELDCGNPSENDEDNESVGSSMDEDNVITDMALRFGHMRRAREALKKAGAL